MPPTKRRNLLDEVRDVMRLHHYSIHTERTYSEWIKKYVHFHGMNSRDDLKNGEKKIEAFLTHLAVNKNVAPATQNQAMNALVFLYKKVLKNQLDEAINAVRSTKKVNVPVVMTRKLGDVHWIIGYFYSSRFNPCSLRTAIGVVSSFFTLCANLGLKGHPHNLSSLCM